MEILRSPLYNHISSLIACNSIELSSSQMIKRTNGGGSNILPFSKSPNKGLQQHICRAGLPLSGRRKTRKWKEKAAPPWGPWHGVPISEEHWVALQRVSLGAEGCSSPSAGCYCVRGHFWHDARWLISQEMGRLAAGWVWTQPAQALLNEGFGF